MCFSAPVSFTASGVLGVTGVLSLSKVKSSREIPLATIPLLFGIQQLIEGFIWLGVGNGNIGQVFVYGFLFFAYLIWPFYIPLSVWLIEPVSKKKKQIMTLLFLGVAVCIYLLVVTLLFHKVEVEVVGCHIGHPYAGNIWYAFIFPFYLATVGFAPLLSSFKTIRIFGATVILSSLVSLIFALTAFTSVWCFAAAILSVIILFYFLKEKRD